MTALSYTVAVFALILVLARLKVPLWAAILIGAFVIAALFGQTPLEAATAAGQGAIQPITIALIVITILLLSLSETMRAAGQLEQIVSLAGSLLRRPAVAMAALPALIGLLPMPGGALFSAPMVESAAGKTKIPGGTLSAVNYWFRHIWEHWWPLYPGVILAVTLTHSGLGAFVAFQIPLGIFMIGAGLLIFRGTHPDLHAAAPRPTKATPGALLRATSSIWVVMIVWGVASAGMRVLPAGLLETPESSPMRQASLETMRRFIPITLGLLASLVWTVRLSRMTGRKVVRVLTRRSTYALAVLVAGVMIFQYMLEHLGIAPRIGQELTGMKVPAALVVVILPFVAGMVTGLAIGFVGTSFPIVMALVEALPDHPPVRPYAVLAYASGHLGMMLSPLHLCHVVSNRYFKTGFAPVYRHILPSAAVTGALAAAYFFLLRTVMK